SSAFRTSRKLQPFAHEDQRRSQRQNLVNIMQLSIDLGGIGDYARHLGAQRVAISLPQACKPHAQSFDRCLQSLRDLFLVRWSCRATRDAWPSLIDPLK